MRKQFWRLVLALFLVLLLAAPGVAVMGDVVIPRRGSTNTGVRPAVFPHWIHRIRYRCYACHPAICTMKAGADEITMGAILEGRYCGKCHNGKIAWAVGIETCNRCHTGE